MTAETKPVDVLTQSAPPRVWLQVDVDGDPEDRSEALAREFWEDVTWCSSSLGGQEVEYIRADQVAELIEAARTQLATDKHYGLGGAAHHQLAAAVARIGGAP